MKTHIDSLRLGAERAGRIAALCKFCRIEVNLDDEGYTYRDGTCGHEHCGDSDLYQKANKADCRD